MSKLSFAEDDEEGEDGAQEDAKSDKKHGRSDEEGGESPSSTKKSSEPVFKKSKFGKDPNIDTSFLPDREREEEERRVREQLRQEWLKKQEEIKREPIQITYSYWDGTGHRKEVEVRRKKKKKKKDTPLSTRGLLLSLSRTLLSRFGC